MGNVHPSQCISTGIYSGATTEAWGKQRPPQQPRSRPRKATQRQRAYQQDVNVCEGNEDACCVVCLRPFTKVRPQMCLPCNIANGEISRHCILCRPCLIHWIETSANKDHTECPKCRHQYNTVQLLEALYEKNCLTFPENTERTHNLKGWNVTEEDGKRQCLENLRGVTQTANKVLNRDYIIANLPTVCNKILHMSGINDTLKQNLIALRNREYVPAPEDYEGIWHLQYSTSVTVDPFPNNLNNVVVGCWFRVWNETPSASQWRFFSGTEDVDNAFSDSALTMRMVIHSIGFLRASLGVSNDNDELFRLMRPGFIRSLCTDANPILRNHMKVLMYAKMFQMNAIQEAVPRAAVQFAQAALEHVVRVPQTANDSGLVFVLWTLLGRTVITYLFRLVEIQNGSE